MNKVAEGKREREREREKKNKLYKCLANVSGTV
jgi:hypothetical protein